MHTPCPPFGRVGSAREREEGNVVRHVGAILAVVVSAIALAACGGSGSGPVTLNWYVFPEPSGSFAKAAADCSKASGGKYKIDDQLPLRPRRISSACRSCGGWPRTTPRSTSWRWTSTGRPSSRPPSGSVRCRRQRWRRQIHSAGSPRPGQDRDLAGQALGGADQLQHPAALVPQGSRARRPPKTWNQMIDDAIKLAKEGKPHYIEEQGAQYEGLTVWFNSMVDSAGGQIIVRTTRWSSARRPRPRRRSCSGSRPRRPPIRA